MREGDDGGVTGWRWLSSGGEGNNVRALERMGWGVWRG